jgi:HAE1 family hydrophobic/amphiphilic exporter-1
LDGEACIDRWTQRVNFSSDRDWLGEGREQRPRGRAVIGGLITSTLLTLFVVPVVYTLLDDFTARMRRGRGTGGQHGHAHRVVPAPALAREPEPVAAD